MKSNVYPVSHFQGNTNTLQNHLDTLLDVASSQDKNLQAINKAYSGLIKNLILAAQGKGDEISKAQLDCIKILLAEHKHLNKVVSDVEQLIKKVREASTDTTEEGEKSPVQATPTLPPL